MRTALLFFLVVGLTACATTKKAFKPLTQLFEPIHLEEGMTKDEVASKFYCKTPEKKLLEDGTEVWIYTVGYGMLAANDRHARQLGGYEWLIYFNDGKMVDEKCYQY